MSDTHLIHTDRLSEKPAAFEGSFRPGELERLAESLASGEGELRYRISARLDRPRLKVLSCIIEGFVFLTCQTTLETFRHEVSIADRLVLVATESELPAIEEEGDAEDYIVAGDTLDIRDLVEDAVLLSLPMVPRKPGQELTGEAGAQEARSPSPFAALASLKRKD
jgi:uncharacterized protein